MRRNTFATSLLVFSCLAAHVRPEASRDFDYVVIDGVKIPFGKVIEVSGPPPESALFELTHATTRLRVLRIDGRANQDGFYAYLFPTDNNQKTSYDGLRSLEQGRSYYKVRGRFVFARLIGRRVLSLQVEDVAAIEPAPLEFADFLDRAATFEGTAAGGGRLQTERESARVEGVADWPKSAAWRKIAVRGVIRRDGTGWRLERSTWRLVELADQVGQEVSLEGVLEHDNLCWWFRYRDEPLYLTSAAGPKLTFPPDEAGRRLRVTGRLLRQDRPSLDQTDRTDRDLVPCFVIRGPKVEYLEEPSDWQHRFGPIYGHGFPTIRDGVPELLAESTYQKNPTPGATDALFFARRNADVIDGILRQATPETREVLARRMNDRALPKAIRLLYAGMLMWLDDARGRSFLLDRAEANGPPNLDALYCLGRFLSAAPAKADIRWAEKTLIALMTSRKELTLSLSMMGRPGRFTVADAVARYNDIPRVLLRMNSAQGRRGVVDYLIANGRVPEKAELIMRIYTDDISWSETDRPQDASGGIGAALSGPGTLGTQVRLPIEDLLKLEAVAQDGSSPSPIITRSNRIAILSEFLRHKHRSAAERFLTDLEDGFVDMEFRDRSSPEVIAALKPHIEELTGKARKHAQMLVVLGQKDPIPSLLAQLGDPKWTDKSFTLYELARLADPRAVVPVARVLREAAPGYLSADPETSATSAVVVALEAIANAGTTEAIRTLVELLPIDLAPFGADIDRKGLQRKIAAHLIELTGESFGVDADAWRNWQRAHPEVGRKP
jgi:hypothetical protein